MQFQVKSLNRIVQLALGFGDQRGHSAALPARLLEFSKLFQVMGSDDRRRVRLCTPSFPVDTLFRYLLRKTSPSLLVLAAARQLSLCQPNSPVDSSEATGTDVPPGYQ